MLASAVPSRFCSDFGCFAAHFGNLCPTTSPCGAFTPPPAPTLPATAATPGPSSDGPASVAIRAVVVASATLEEVTDVLPGSLRGLRPGTPFVLEVWAQSADATGRGLACVFVDVEFEPMTMAATGRTMCQR